MSHLKQTGREKINLTTWEFDTEETMLNYAVGGLATKKLREVFEEDSVWMSLPYEYKICHDDPDGDCKDIDDPLTLRVVLPLGEDGAGGDGVQYETSLRTVINEMWENGDYTTVKMILALIEALRKLADDLQAQYDALPEEEEDEQQ